MATTLGQLMVNDELPEEYRDSTRALGKSEADALLAKIAHSHPELYKSVSHKLMQLGREAAYTEGSTLRLSDLRAPFDKTDLIKHVHSQEAIIRADKTMSPAEKEEALTTVYEDMRTFITEQTYTSAVANNNAFGTQVKSKARGNKQQLAALLSTPSAFQDAQNRTIPVFIGHSFAEGLDPAEYWAATYGARKGVISTKFATRDAGALGKQLGVAVADMVVTGEDCETAGGIPVEADDDDNLGAELAQQVGDFPSGTVISKEVLAEIRKAKTPEILIRSPVTCSYSQGVCKHCVGLRENGSYPEIGHHVGLNAASALAEQIAQSSLNQKHSGGQKDSKGKMVFTGFDVINNLAQIPSNFPHRATVATIDGKIDKIEPASQGGNNIHIGGEIHYVAPELPVFAKVGDTVEAGDQLSDGILNPADVVTHKGIGEGRRYLAQRLTQAFKDNSFGVNRRNVEVLARSMVDHVNVDEQDGVGHYLPGDVVSYSGVAYSYKPRKDAQVIDPSKALGQYLEAPALHYTIGTRITPSVVARLKNYNIGAVTSHAQPAGFTPSMVSITKAPQYKDDWMARLGTTYLKPRLLQDVHRGAVSQSHGLNPIPSLAKGVEFGEPKDKTKGFAY